MRPSARQNGTSRFRNAPSGSAVNREDPGPATLGGILRRRRGQPGALGPISKHTPPNECALDAVPKRSGNHMYIRHNLEAHPQHFQRTRRFFKAEGSIGDASDAYPPTHARRSPKECQDAQRSDRQLSQQRLCGGGAADESQPPSEPSASCHGGPCPCAHAPCPHGGPRGGNAVHVASLQPLHRRASLHLQHQ